MSSGSQETPHPNHPYRHTLTSPPFSFSCKPPLVPLVNYSKWMPIIPPSCWLKTKPPLDKTTTIYNHNQHGTTTDMIMCLGAVLLPWRQTNVLTWDESVSILRLFRCCRNLSSPVLVSSSFFHFFFLLFAVFKILLSFVCVYGGGGVLFSEMLDELQTTLPKSHLVYHSPGHARGCRNVSVCSIPPAPTMADSVRHSLNGNNFKKSWISVEWLSVSGRPQAIVHLWEV